MARTDNHEATLVSIYAGAIDGSNSVRANVTTNITTSTVTVVTAPAIPTATTPWMWLQIINNHATATLSFNLNGPPTASSGSLPGIAWGNGQDIPAGGSALIRIGNTLTNIQILSDTASTPVILNLIA